MENPASRPSFKNTSVGAVPNISVSVVMGLRTHWTVQTKRKLSKYGVDQWESLLGGSITLPLNNSTVKSANKSSM
jgi:hypothetical protein